MRFDLHTSYMWRMLGENRIHIQQEVKKIRGYDNIKEQYNTVDINVYENASFVTNKRL